MAQFSFCKVGWKLCLPWLLLSRRLFIPSYSFNRSVSCRQPAFSGALGTPLAVDDFQPPYSVDGPVSAVSDWMWTFSVGTYVFSSSKFLPVFSLDVVPSYFLSSVSPWTFWRFALAPLHPSFTTPPFFLTVAVCPCRLLCELLGTISTSAFDILFQTM